MALSGYVRVSRVGGREGDGFISPDVQEAAILEWAQRNGRYVVMEEHELNRSGGTMDRPIFNAIMQKVRNGESEGVVVYKTDRFARTTLGALTTLAELGEHKAAFASATEPELDYSTPAGKAFLSMLFVFSQFVRDSLKESWATTAVNAISRGIHISPADYLGYDIGDDRRLVPNEQAPLVAEVFRRRAAGESWVSLADFLNEAAPKEGAKIWTGQSVARITKKRVYLGEASRYVDQDEDGRGPIVNADAHPAIVTEAEFQAAQIEPSVTFGGKGGESSALLGGLIRCAGCRYSMSRGSGPKGEPLYRCRSKHASGKCPEPAFVSAGTIEQYVEGLLLAELDGSRTRLVPDDEDRDQILEQLALARADYDGFRRDTEARRIMSRDDWLDSLKSYAEAVEALEADLQKADTAAGGAAVFDGLTRDVYLGLPLDERRKILGGFMDCVFVKRSRGRGRNVDPIDTRTRVLWRGEGPDDLPRRRVVNEIRSFSFDDGVVSGVASA